VDVYHSAKFHPHRIRSFVSAHARFRASNCLLGYLFVFWGSSSHLQPRRPHGFWRKIRQKMRFRARMCLLGSQSQKLSFTLLFAPKNHHFGALFRRDLEIFARKRLWHHRSSIKCCIVNRHIGVGDSKNVIVLDPLLTGHVICRMRRHRVSL